MYPSKITNRNPIPYGESIPSTSYAEPSSSTYCTEPSSSTYCGEPSPPTYYAEPSSPPNYYAEPSSPTSYAQPSPSTSYAQSSPSTSSGTMFSSSSKIEHPTVFEPEPLASTYTDQPQKLSDSCVPEENPEKLDAYFVMKDIEKNCVQDISYVIKKLQNAPEIVRDLLSQSCSLIMECRICKNFYRSVYAFKIHKKKFCDKRIKDVLCKCGCGSVPPCKIQGAILLDRSTTKNDLNLIFDPVKNITQVVEVSKKDLNINEKLNKELIDIRFARVARDEEIKALKPISGNSQTKAFECSYCLEVYDTRKALAYHTKLHAEAASLKSCPLCEHNFSNARAFYDHIKNAHNLTQEFYDKVVGNFNRLHNRHARRKPNLNLFSSSVKDNISRGMIFDLNEQRNTISKLTGVPITECNRVSIEESRRPGLRATSYHHTLYPNNNPQEITRSLKRKALEPLKVVLSDSVKQVNSYVKMYTSDTFNTPSNCEDMLNQFHDIVNIDFSISDTESDTGDNKCSSTIILPNNRETDPNDNKTDEENSMNETDALKTEDEEKKASDRRSSRQRSRDKRKQPITNGDRKRKR